MRPSDEAQSQPTRDVGKVADEALHPQQGSAQGEHDDGNVRPAAQADVEQHDDGQPHHGDEARTGLEFPIHFHVHALSQEQGDGGAVVGAQVAFEVHVTPFGGATGPFGLKFQTGFLGVLRWVKHQLPVGQSVAAHAEAFVGELHLLLLVSVLPNDFPPHLLQFRAVELHQQPGGGTGPAALAPQCALPRSVGEQLAVNRAFLVGGVVGLEAAVEGEPAQEVVVGGLGHAGGRHVDVSLGDVGVVKFQTVERETIRPVGRWFGDDAQRREAGLGENGGVVHEAAEVVRQRDGAVGLMPGYVVHERLEGRRERVLEHEVEFGVQFLQHGQVEDATGRIVNARPRFSGRNHLGGMGQRGVVGRTVGHAGHGLPVLHGGDEVGVAGRDEEPEDDLRIREFLVDDGLRRQFGRFHLVGLHVDGLEGRHRPGNHQQREQHHGDVGTTLAGQEPRCDAVVATAHVLKPALPPFEGMFSLPFLFTFIALFCPRSLCTVGRREGLLRSSEQKIRTKNGQHRKLGEHANVYGIKDNPEHCAALIVAGIAAPRVQF